MLSGKHASPQVCTETGLTGKGIIVVLQATGAKDFGKYRLLATTTIIVVSRQTSLANKGVWQQWIFH